MRFLIRQNIQHGANLCWRIRNDDRQVFANILPNLVFPAESPPYALTIFCSNAGLSGQRAEIIFVSIRLFEVEIRKIFSLIAALEPLSPA